MPQAAAREDAAVVEGGDGVRVDARREGQRRLDEAVFEQRDELRFPAQSLHLPGSEAEGSDGDEGCDMLVGAWECNRERG